MKKIKKVLRLFALILLIMLASVGVGIVGGIPVKPSGRKEDPVEIGIRSEESSGQE